MSADEIFTYCVCEAIKVHGERALFEGLSVARQTVQRWAQGKALPHPSMRKPLYYLIVRLGQASTGSARAVEATAVGPVQSGSLRKYP